MQGISDSMIFWFCNSWILWLFGPCPNQVTKSDIHVHNLNIFWQENMLKVVDVVKEDLEFPNKKGNPLTALQQVSPSFNF